MTSNKEPIIHFKGKDMPASEWLQKVFATQPEPILVWCGENQYAANTVEGYRRLLRLAFPDLSDEKIEEMINNQGGRLSA